MGFAFGSTQPTRSIRTADPNPTYMLRANDDEDGTDEAGTVMILKLKSGRHQD